jgi:small subunit ribosomal protein S16
MLVIRLIRTGKRNAASFRVILVEKTASPKTGKFLEILGNYNPRLKELNLKKDRIKHWLAQGVKTSDTVHNLLVKDGIIKGPKIKKKLKSKKAKTDQEQVSDKKEEPKEDKKGLTKSKEKSKVEKE